jgi:hypothetical protein
MKILLSAAMMVLVLCLPVSSPAFDFSGQSRTYALSRETVDGTKLLPFFEYLDFRADDVTVNDLSFHFGGWLGYESKEEIFGSKSTGDLQYGYLSYRPKQSNARVDLGRFIVSEGAAVAQLDGLHARTDLLGGFNAAVFGGIPVLASTSTATGGLDFKSRTGDSVYGGRFGHSTDYTRIGVSYLREKDDHVDFRKEESVDLWLRPASVVELTGTSSYNALTKEWMQHTYHLTLVPVSNLILGTDANRIVYKDYFQASTVNVFKLTPGILDPNERMKSIGETASYVIGPATLSLSYTAYSYDIAGNAKNYGGMLAFGGMGGGFGLGAHRMNGETDKLRYTDYRVYAYKKFGPADITADAMTISYDSAINGIKTGYSASLAGGYGVTERAKVKADVEYGHNPFYDRDVRGLVQFVYNFGTIPGAKGGK